MSDPKRLDVLIVYSELDAVSAAFADAGIHTPFPIGSRAEEYNVIYGYFLKKCADEGLTAGFSTSADVIAGGTCSSFWTFRNNCWQRQLHPVRSNVIFTKVSPTSAKLRARRKLLFSSSEVRPFNQPGLYTLFTDKLLTYRELREFTIPTVLLSEQSPEGVEGALAQLKKLIKKHPHTEDFSPEVILKDRYGIGGNKIFKFTPGSIGKILTVLQENKDAEFILQPFVRFTQGYEYQGRQVAADIRLVFLSKKCVQSYVRLAKQGDFRCNLHQGGTAHFLKQQQLPEPVVKLARKVVGTIKDDGSLYSLDFVMSDSGHAYLLEGNPNPGLDWDVKLNLYEREHKYLIGKVIGKLGQMVNSPILALE